MPENEGQFIDEYRNAFEQELDYGQGNAEVSWAIKHQEGGRMNLANLPIQIAVKNASLMSAEEFALIRRKGFGGSDASILLGANPYTKTYEEVQSREGITESLVKQKARMELTPEEKLIGEKSAVRKGNDLEPLIIKKASEVFGLRILKPDDMYRFKEYPYLTMNFDGVGIFLKPEKKIIDPTEYLEDVPTLHGRGAEAQESYEGRREVKYPAPDFSWLGNHHGYAPVEIKVATIRGQSHYNPVKAVYSEQRLYRSQNPWAEAPVPLTDSELRLWSVEEKARYFGIPIYYYPQIQQEMMACDANGGFLAVLFEVDWQMHIFYIQKDPVIWNQIIIEGLKAGKAVNAYLATMGRPPEIALTPEMYKKMDLKTELPQEAAADPTIELIKARGSRFSETQPDPRWQDDF